MQLDQVAHDAEAEPEAAVRPRAGAVCLPEPLEDVRQELCADPLARIAHGELDVRLGAPEVDVDAPAFGRELDGIRQEVPDHLLEARGVARDVLRSRRER